MKTSGAPLTRQGDSFSSDAEITAFLGAIAAAPSPSSHTGRGRLIFALDATASREPTWDRACHVQAEMFTEADRLGGLSIQLVYFRGFGEFQAAPWISESAPLVRRMTGVSCSGGHTQIAKVLDHALRETGNSPVAALVYIGDCCEEGVDDVCQKAGELGLRGVPAFVFQEGRDAVADKLFPRIAELTGGAYCRFDSASASRLRDLLRVVAAYASGGHQALLTIKRSDTAEEIAGQLRPPRR